MTRHHLREGPGIGRRGPSGASITTWACVIVPFEIRRESGAHRAGLIAERSVDRSGGATRHDERYCSGTTPLVAEGRRRRIVSDEDDDVQAARGVCDLELHGTSADEIIKAQDRHLKDIVAGAIRRTNLH